LLRPAGGYLRPALVRSVLLAEGLHAGSGLDAADDELLELRRPGEGAVGDEILGVVSERRQERPTAVVVLAPRHRVVTTETGVAHRSPRAAQHGGLVDGGEDPHLAREGNEVVPLVGEVPAGGKV